VYYLIYTSPNSGPCQVSTTGPAPVGGLGQFVRDSSFVGRQLALPQLSAGEVYTLLTTNIGISNVTTLVINSPTSGALVTSGMPAGSGISLVSVLYSYLGPLSCQLQVIIPAGSGFPSPQTNLYCLVYTSTSSGPFQVSSSGAGLTSLGLFARDRALVGQQLAPTQLTVGEDYSMTFSNGPTAITDTLIVNSPTDGIVVRQGSGTDDGIYPGVALQYAALGNIMAQLQAVIQQPPPMQFLHTNTYLFLYTVPNAGQVQRLSDPSISLLGQFSRNPPQ
jgi:hypothetical protein